MPENDSLLARIDAGLDAAGDVFATFGRDRISEMRKTGGDPVTEADIALDHVLKEALLEPGEGWLSEETADDRSRLEHELVWIVDPLDGTREFIDGLPEFCASIAAVIDGHAVAGGVLNPAAGLRIVGAVGVGVRMNGQPAHPPADRRVLASRSEWNRGQWSMVVDAGLEVVPMGSVAYKFARVAAGLDHSTWTPVPKHEWDVAGGAALLNAAGGAALGLDGSALRFNNDVAWLPGAVAAPPWFGPVRETTFDLISRQTA